MDLKYLQQVHDSILSIPGVRDYSVALFAALVVSKDTKEESIKVDTEIVSPSGLRVSNSLFNKAMSDDKALSLVLSLFNPTARNVIGYEAFDVELGHLWKDHKVLDSKVFIFSCNARQLDILESL